MKGDTDGRLKRGATAAREIMNAVHSIYRMNILGINAYHGNASAAIVCDGRLVAAVEEERFNRVKYAAGFPALAIRYCLKAAGLNAAGNRSRCGAAKSLCADGHEIILCAAHALFRPRPGQGTGEIYRNSRSARGRV